METNDFTRTLQGARDQRRDALDEPSGKKILKDFGISVPNSLTVPEGSPFSEAARQLKRPLVLKLVSEDVVHKTEMGGVCLNLDSEDGLEQAAAQIRMRAKNAGARISGWLVEEMAAPGVEVVIGGVQDPEFGPMVMIGLGGIFVEVFGDVAFRICPVTREDVLDMLDELKGGAVLRGVRGREAVNMEALVVAILRVGGADGVLLAGRDHIAELDINPLIASSSGVVAVDARFILKV